MDEPARKKRATAEGVELIRRIRALARPYQRQIAELNEELARVRATAVVSRLDVERLADLLTKNDAAHQHFTAFRENLDETLRMHSVMVGLDRAYQCIAEELRGLSRY